MDSGKIRLLTSTRHLDGTDRSIFVSYESSCGVWIHAEVVTDFEGGCRVDIRTVGWLWSPEWSTVAGGLSSFREGWELAHHWVRVLSRRYKSGPMGTGGIFEGAGGGELC